MAASIAKLAAIATLNSENFTQNVDKMQRKLQAFKRYEQAQNAKSAALQKDGAIGGIAKSLGALEKVGKVMFAAEAGINALKIGTAIWNGDIEKAQGLLEQLPAGIGSIIKSVRELREEWGLMPAYVYETKDALKEIEEQNKKNDAARASAKSGNALSDRFSGIARQGNQTWNASGMNEYAADEYMEKMASEERLKAIDSEVADWKIKNASATEDTIKRVENAARAAREGEMYASGSRIKKIRDRQAADALEVQKRAEDEARREREKAAEVAQEQYKRQTDLQIEVAAEAMKAQGKEVEAERLRNAAEYYVKIQEAEKAGDMGTAGLLRTRMRQEDAAIAGSAKATGAGGTAVAFDPRYQARGAMSMTAQPKPVPMDPEALLYIKNISTAIAKYGMTGVAQ